MKPPKTLIVNAETRQWILTGEYPFAHSCKTPKADGETSLIAAPDSFQAYAGLAELLPMLYGYPDEYPSDPMNN